MTRENDERTSIPNKSLAAAQKREKEQDHTNSFS
jgi:hypothetical protein